MAGATATPEQEQSVLGELSKKRIRLALQYVLYPAALDLCVAVVILAGCYGAGMLLQFALTDAMSYEAIQQSLGWLGFLYIFATAVFAFWNLFQIGRQASQNGDEG